MIRSNALAVAFNEFHPKNRERIALAVNLVATENGEAYMPVKACGLGVLLVHVDVNRAVFINGQVDKAPPDALAEILGRDEKHLYLLFLQPHERNVSAIVRGNDKRSYAFQCFPYIRLKAQDVGIAEEIMARPYRRFP